MNSSRRDFLKASAVAGIAGAAWNPWLQLQALAQTASGQDYKALVCLFLFGGNDGNNLLVPLETADHALYAKARSNLTLPAAGLLPISPTNTGGRRFGLHPSLPGIKSLFDGGKATLLANTGPLIVPTSKAQFENRSVPLPNYLFSHSDQQIAWHTDSFNPQVRGGWAGRMLERVVAPATTNRDYSCVSVSGSALWGTGDALEPMLPYRVPSTGKFGFEDYGPQGHPALTAALDSLIAETRSDIFEIAWVQSLRRSMDNQMVLDSALKNAPLSTVFPNTDLGRQLGMVARLVNAKGALGLSRQCFFCSIGGFDTHGEDQLWTQAAKFAEIDNAVAAFMESLKAMGLENNVTLFTASDFGRTLVSNSRGSDHGWGNHHLVVGGAVNGGKILGRFPNHTVGGPDDIGSGNWIPSLAIDQVGAELGRWFGAGSALPEVFPQMGNFDTNLGLMAA